MTCSMSTLVAGLILVHVKRQPTVKTQEWFVSSALRMVKPQNHYVGDLSLDLLC